MRTFSVRALVLHTDFHVWYWDPAADRPTACNPNTGIMIHAGNPTSATPLIPIRYSHSGLKVLNIKSGTTVIRTKKTS
jgi:hypothetical protein